MTFFTPESIRGYLLITIITLVFVAIPLSGIARDQLSSNIYLIIVLGLSSLSLTRYFLYLKLTRRGKDIRFISITMAYSLMKLVFILGVLLFTSYIGAWLSEPLIILTMITYSIYLFLDTYLTSSTSRAN